MSDDDPAIPAITARACAAYGTVTGWPAWERTCRQAGLRPIYGLVFDLHLEGAEGRDPWPVLALAATGVGLRHLVRLHNGLARHPDGSCTAEAGQLAALAEGLWLVL